MIDIHSHILYGIDDGAKTLEDSIEILCQMQSLGYTDIILTPHYIKDTQYASPVSENVSRLEILKKTARKENIDINLYLGNEIYIDDEILSLLKSRELKTLNNSKFLLIELPMSGIYSNYQEIFEYLIANGYEVILAHPERYLSFANNIDKARELTSSGVKLQCNVESIIGSYGKNAEKMVKKLLKAGLVTYLASDIHRPKRDLSKIELAYKKIVKIVGKDKFEELTSKNAIEILEDI